MSKSAGSHIGSAIQNAVNIKKIIEAFLRGGWKAAAFEAAKRYWPYILAAAVILQLLPIVLFVSLPGGFSGKNKDEKAEPTVDSSQYETMCDDRIADIREENSDDTAEVAGQPIEFKKFYAICLVLSGNDTEKITGDYIAGRIEAAIVYQAVSDETNTENRIFEIRYLTPDEYMTALEFSDADKDWVQYLYEQSEDNESE